MSTWRRYSWCPGSTTPLASSLLTGINENGLEAATTTPSAAD
jgi:hypothetical protein